MSVIAAGLNAAQFARVEPTIAPITWAVDPGAPGPNLPPAGRSLFDQMLDEPTLKAATNSHPERVPFPFAALVHRIEEHLGPDPAGAAPLRRVLIPFSRSLQRNAASPEFLRFPRAILAVDSQRGAGPGHAPGPLLEDRLFLGYQEKAGLIEVISYNEEAGRFEFQVVRNYLESGKAQVIYAQRALCIACHQNAAPIFSRQLWDETNANPRIARGLHRQGRQFYGFPIDQGFDIFASFQAATDRANLMAVYQLLWREGCGAVADGGARSCRAALFTAVLQQALTGGQRFDTAADGFRRRFVEPFVAAWHRRWPHGLAIPDPDLPNRNPLAERPEPPGQLSVSPPLGAADAALLADVARQSNVPARLDPLEPRAPLETWSPGDATVERIVSGLAEFLKRDEIAALDQRLFELGSGQREARRVEEAPCTFALRRRSGERTVASMKVTCGAVSESDDSAASGRYLSRSSRLTISGTVDLAERGITGGEIEWIAIGGRVQLSDLAIASSNLRLHGGSWELRLRLADQRSGMHARLPGGDAVEDLDLTVAAPGLFEAVRGSAPGANDPRDSASGRLSVYGGSARLRLLADFKHAEAAVGDILGRKRREHEDVFGDDPFRRRALIGALFARLGIHSHPSAAEARVSSTPISPPAAEPAAESRRASSSSAALRAFVHYCSTCHGTAETSPPNFLAGGPEQIEGNLAHCAERIFFRLSMWQLEDSRRSKTPMPPTSALQAFEVDPQSWSRDPDLLFLTASAGDLLRRQTGSQPHLDELEARGYEALRSCLPSNPRAARRP